MKNICYKGKVFSKQSTLKKYKFSICYENTWNLDNLVTEKIFDSFSAGCVPVYWGAKNIKELIPESCYIDKTKFSTYDELYHYLKTMDDAEYLTYLKNIDTFIHSKQALKFTSSYYAETLVKFIKKDLKIV
jgi:hypothetical protein